MQFWWVNQGQTFDEESAKELIRAPKANSDGDTKFHWTNVRDVEAGDIVFSYVSGFIRAVSIAVSDGDTEELTQTSVDTDGEQDDAWVARLKYTELDSPVPLAPIANVLRKSTEKYAPIGKTGRVNQGYLYALDEQAVRVLGETLDLDALPDRVADPIKSLLGDQWGKFVYWGRRFFAVDSIRNGEREYTFSSEKRLVEVRDMIETGEGDWVAVLKTAFTRNDSLTAWRSHGKFLEWCQANRDATKQLLASFWDDSHELIGASKQFLESLPVEALRGTGARVSILSFLALARDPLSCPMFRSTPFETGIRLTGYPLLPKAEIEVYPHALDFLDRIIREAIVRGFALQDRLDAQCFLWCVAEYDAPDEWTDEDKLALKNWRDGMAKAESNPSMTGLSALADELLLDASYLQEIERLIESKGQVIFYGPPGTGKTYVAKAIAKHYAGEEGIVIVQFHPSYTYEDFVEGYRPCLHDGQPGFDLVKGPLRLLAQRAEENPDSKFVLLVDEINRGNVAKVFGELYFLLEYRDEGINLQYDRDTKFKLPKNLWIIGTMNTADRSIALIDSALRRRFYFCPFFPDEQPVEPLLRRWLWKNKPHLEWVADVVREANERLGDRHGAIGPSYFLRDDLTASWVETIWKHAILPYLAEQFFGEEERLDEFDLTTLRKAISQTSEITADEAN